MIEVTPQLKTQFKDVFKIARREKFRVVWLEDDLIFVARRQPGHDRYLLKLGVSGRGLATLSCKSTVGRACDGVIFKKGFCAHMAAFLLRGIPKSREKQESEAA